MADNINDNSKVRPLEEGVKEAAELFLDSLWQDRVKPKVDQVVALFTNKECHEAGHSAGTDLLQRAVNRLLFSKVNVVSVADVPGSAVPDHSTFSVVDASTVTEVARMRPAIALSSSSVAPPCGSESINPAASPNATGSVAPVASLTRVAPYGSGAGSAETAAGASGRVMDHRAGVPAFVSARIHDRAQRLYGADRAALSPRLA